MAENRRRRAPAARPRGPVGDKGPTILPVGASTEAEAGDSADRVVDLTVVGMTVDAPHDRNSSAPGPRPGTVADGDGGEIASTPDVEGSPSMRAPLDPRTRRVLLTAAASIAFVVLAAGVAAAWSSRGADVYAATAEVRYRAVDNPAFGAADRALEAQTQAILSRSVVVPAAEVLAVGPEALRSRLRVSLLADSDVLRIEALHDSAEEAERTLAVVVDTYIERVEAESPDDGRLFLESELATLETRIAAVEAQLREPGRDPASAATLQLQTDYAALLDQRTFLAERLADLAVQELDAPRVDMLAEPHASTDPVEPRPARAALVAAVTAGLLAVLGAYFILRRPQLG